MLTRLWKEIRALGLWFGIIIVGCMATYFAIQQMPLVQNPPQGSMSENAAYLLYCSMRAEYVNITLCLYLGLLLVFNLAAASLFGMEFQSGVIQRLLTQPISRNRIWLEKTSALLLLVFIAVACCLLLSAQMTMGLLRYAALVHPDFWKDKGFDFLYFWEINRDFVFVTVSVGLMACATAPTLSLWLRQAHTTFWASIILPMLIGLILTNLNTLIYRITGVSLFYPLQKILETYMGNSSLRGSAGTGLFAFFLFCILYPIGWWKFRRLEV